MRRVFALLAVLVVVASFALGARSSGAAGGPLYSLSYPALNGQFGTAVATGDVDGDGKSDIIVGAPCCSYSDGNVHVFSGATGARLFTLSSPNPQAGSEFGHSVAVGDVDGDGTPDIVVGAPGEMPDATLHNGRVYVFSGRTRLLIYTFVSPNTVDGSPACSGAPGDRFGDAVAVGDIDGAFLDRARLQLSRAA